MLAFLEKNQTILIILLLGFIGFITMIILNENGKFKFPQSLYHHKYNKLDDKNKVKDLKRSIDMIKGLPNEHPYRQNRLIDELQEEHDLLIKKMNKDKS